MVPKIRALTTPIILLFVLANNSPFKKVVRARFPILNTAATEALHLIILLVSLDPKCSVFVYLGVLKTRKLMPFTDASGWERGIMVKNPAPGCLGGFFTHTRKSLSFAFSLP